MSEFLEKASDVAGKSFKALNKYVKEQNEKDDFKIMKL